MSNPMWDFMKGQKKRKKKPLKNKGLNYKNGGEGVLPTGIPIPSEPFQLSYLYCYFSTYYL